MASSRALHFLTPYRGISSTPHLASIGWFDKIKSTFTGKKPEASEADSFTLISKSTMRPSSASAPLSLG